MNNSVLEDSRYKTCIQKLLDDISGSSLVNVLSKRMLWDFCKSKIRSFTIQFCRENQRLRKSRLKLLEQKIFQISKDMSDNPTPRNVSAFDKLNLEYNLASDYESKGARIRSKTRWFEVGEKSTKYFLNLEKCNAKRKRFCTLLNGQGEQLHDQGDILEEQVKFYESLYSPTVKDVDSKFSEFVSGCDIKHLSDDDKYSCEGKITLDECANALGKMANGKSPGLDGLTKEFYVTFWGVIEPIVVDSLNEAYDNGELSVSQKRGLISLLYKGKGDARSLNNWRPISLLNIDYKIATRVLATRIRQVLPSLIGPDQTGFMKGRFIGENIRLMEDTIRQCEKCNIPGVVLSLDFKKAFDCIDRKYIMRVLEYMNFGPSLRKWIYTVYNDSMSCIINNGWVSGYFNIHRGVRQGCPLSPLLFILGVEILAAKIKQNPLIKGISLPKRDYPINTVTLTQYADDMTLFLGDDQSFIPVLGILGEFQHVSGLSLNKRKTEAMWIGSNNT